MGGAGFGLVRGLVGGVGAVQAGQKEQRELERRARLDLLQQRLLEAHIGELQAQSWQRRQPHQPQNIDPLSEAGIAATVERQRRLGPSHNEKRTSQKEATTRREQEAEGYGLNILANRPDRAKLPGAPAELANALRQKYPQMNIGQLTAIAERAVSKHRTTGQKQKPDLLGELLETAGREGPESAAPTGQTPVTQDQAEYLKSIGRWDPNRYRVE